MVARNKEKTNKYDTWCLFGWCLGNNCKFLSSVAVHNWEYSPIWSHCLFPSPDHSGWIYFDSGVFSVHHQQTCTARVQLVLEKKEVWIWETDNKIKGSLKWSHTHTVYTHAPPWSLGVHIYWSCWEHRRLIWQLWGCNPLPFLKEATPETISV